MYIIVITECYLKLAKAVPAAENTAKTVVGFIVEH